MHYMGSFLAGFFAPEIGSGIASFVVFAGGLYLVGKIGTGIIVCLMPLLPWWPLLSLGAFALYRFFCRNDMHPALSRIAMISVFLMPCLQFCICQGWVIETDTSAAGLVFIGSVLVSLIPACMLETVIRQSWPSLIHG